MLLPLLCDVIMKCAKIQVNDTTNSENVIDIFNNLLDESKEGIWRSLQNVSKP